MKNFGFGCMRLPMTKGEPAQVDLEQFRRMVDRFLSEGFTYFDTAHGYLGGKSETALKAALVDRYPRDAYTMTDKLTESFFHTESDIRPLFEKQLERMGLAYFDYYLIHAVTVSHYEKFTRCNAFEIVKQLKAEGKIRHIGMSFHDKAEVLDRVLTEHPEMEVVQIQFNYADYDDPSIQGKAVYDVCQKHQKPVIVMEPCKGGGLIDLPEEAKEILTPLGGSYASFAIRYTASFPSVFMVLSGMSDLGQMEDNLSFMKDFKPFTPEEFTAADQIRGILKEQDTIPCTSCRYCIDGCPKRILIPDLFACYNSKKRYQDWNSNFYYGVSTAGRGKASDCIACGKCENVCPQHLSIKQLLKDVAAHLETA